jgi:hypothetical protein
MQNEWDFFLKHLLSSAPPVGEGVWGGGRNTGLEVLRGLRTTR